MTFLSKNRWLLAFILLFVLTIPVSLGLYGNHLINGHDALGALVRALYMQRYGGDGQFLVRWASDLNFGYGYPMFNFYPPFFYFVSVVFSFLTHDIVQSINLACVLFWVLSGFGMYLFAREFWGHKGGLLSALAYIYAPYHIQDLYVRGAFAEFSSFAFFPLIMLSFYKIYQANDKRYFLLGVVSAFALSLTHNIMSMLFFPVAVVYSLFLFFINRNSRAFYATFLILALGLMASAFFWLPALLEKKFLNLSFLISMRYDFHRNFISLGQLFRLPWSNTTDSDGISFQIGIVHFLLALMPLALISRFFKEKKQAALHYLFFILVGFTFIFLTLPFSQSFWNMVSLLKFVQMPWRLLTIITFAFSFLAGAIMVFFKDRPSANYIFVFVIGLMILMPLKLSSSDHFSKMDKNGIQNNLSNYVFLGEGEYTPKWVQVPPLAFPPQKFEIVQGAGQFSQYTRVSAVEYRIQINADQPSLVCFHSFYFPGWRVFIDGQEAQINPNNKYGLILFVVPQGNHQIRTAFYSTEIRNIGTIISCLGFFLIAVILLRRV